MGPMLACSCCGNAVRPDHNVGSEDFPLCSSCYTLHYNRCARCGALILENHACYYSTDDGEELPYCGACCHTLCEKDIHDYYYKPAPLFYGEPPRYFGVELEIDCGGESSAKARQLERWAARYGFKAQPKEVLDAAKGSGAGRYACINLQNADTVEFRIFRGSLKPSTLLAALELTNQIIDCALYLSDSELQQMSWSTFVSGCQAPALVQYLKERRIYVNEPVESAGEL